jgi:hypothetical protein
LLQDGVISGRIQGSLFFSKACLDRRTKQLQGNLESFGYISIEELRELESCSPEGIALESIFVNENFSKIMQATILVCLETSDAGWVKVSSLAAVHAELTPLENPRDAKRFARYLVSKESGVQACGDIIVNVSKLQTWCVNEAETALNNEKQAISRDKVCWRLIMPFA